MLDHRDTQHRRRGEFAEHRGAKVGPGDTRRHHLALVMRTLFPGERFSRAEISRRTGLTRVTVSDLVAELIDEKLLVEMGRSAAKRPGKPGTLLSIDPDGRRVVSLDLSQPAEMHGAVLDVLGRVTYREVRAAPGSGSGADLLHEVTQFAQELATRPGGRVLGIGIGTPGTVDAGGVVLAAPNLSWKRVPLARTVSDCTRLPVCVENDANSAALAERHLAGGAENLLLVQLARGVGAGILVEGRVVPGSSRAAGEIGHVVVDVDGPMCGCGKRGCLETWVSVPALEARVAQSPDRRAEVLAEAGQRLGEALSFPVAMLDVPDVVVHGPHSIVAPPLVEAVAASLSARNSTGFRADARVRPSELGDDIVLLGAGVLVLRDLLGIF